MLIPTNQTIFMIKQDSIQESIWAYFSIHFPGTITIALIVVDLNDITVGKIQGYL